MSQTIDYAALVAELQKQAAAGGVAAPTAPNANVWANPGVTQGTGIGLGGTLNFFRPNDSKMPIGQDLSNFITNNGTATANDVTNRTVKYDGGLTREMLGNTTGFLSGQINSGFGAQNNAIEDMFNRYGSLGGLGGVAQTGTASSVYRPAGQVQTSNSSTLPWASTNPFNATF